MKIDLNCDMGEGMKTDALIMPWISSANIACGGHAGDERSMQETIHTAKKYKVAIGAHPSYPDSTNFGRVEMNIPHDELYKQVFQQINCSSRTCIAAPCKTPWCFVQYRSKEQTSRGNDRESHS
jgi:UPF0271 protein